MEQLAALAGVVALALLQPAASNSAAKTSSPRSHCGSCILGLEGVAAELHAGGSRRLQQRQRHHYAC